MYTIPKTLRGYGSIRYILYTGVCCTVEGYSLMKLCVALQGWRCEFHGAGDYDVLQISNLGNVRRLLHLRCCDCVGNVDSQRIDASTEDTTKSQCATLEHTDKATKLFYFSN